MRRRQRSSAPPPGWIAARGDGRWTRVGSLDSPWLARVDGAGLVQVDGAGWSLDWWIGAEDRWHVPAREAAVRQALVGNSPVIETKVKIPGGDAVHRAYGARTAAGAEAIVVEIENASTLPFALALAIRPYGIDAPGRDQEGAVAGTDVLGDGRPALSLPRSPARAALGDALADTAAIVFEGGAVPTAETVPVPCAQGLGQAVLLFPLAHTATLRVTIPLPVGATPVPPTSVPDATQVAKGWGVQTRRAARFEVPERRVREAVLASGRHLLLAPPSVVGASALDLLGLDDEAGAALLGDPLALVGAPAGSALAAVARHWSLRPDPEVAKRSAPVAAALVARLGEAEGAELDLAHGALADVVAMLVAAGEDRGAADVRGLIARLGVVDPPLPAPPVADDLPERLADATATWAWVGPLGGHDPQGNASVIALVRSRLVADQGPWLDLSPGVPDHWLGQGWEVHDAPTRHGLLSYAVRWHGERPALLWDLQPHDDAAVPLTIRRLDPTWSADRLAGEALLAPVAIPERPKERRGLSIPVTIEPLRRGPR